MLVVTTSTPRPANAFPQLWASSDQCDMTGTGPTSAMRQTRVLALNLCKSGPRLFGSWLFLGELWLSCSACFDMRAAAATVAGNHVDNRSSQPTANMPSKGNEGQLPAATMTRPVLSAWRASTTCQTKCESNRADLPQGSLICAASTELLLSDLKQRGRPQPDKLMLERNQICSLSEKIFPSSIEGMKTHGLTMDCERLTLAMLFLQV